ncbi:MAG: hypothetical protein NTX49_05060 [Chlamydiae bacterium]|nr:hypothetical protein [Chlamydiota bacterium]
MTSSINSTNPSRTGSWCPAFLTGCCKRRARASQGIASSLEERVGTAASAALLRPLSIEKPLLDNRVSLEEIGIGLSSDIPASIRGSDVSTRTRRFACSSPDLRLGAGIEFTEDELGRTLRSVSLRSPEASFSDTPPLLGFINSPASFERYTPPPKTSEKYDVNKYYTKLASLKGLEDFSFFREGSPSSEEAFAYLASIMPTSGNFLEESYQHVNALLLGVSNSIYRREAVVSFCLVPEEDNSVLNADAHITSVDSIFEEKGMGKATIYQDVSDSAGRSYFIYRVSHSPDRIAEKLQDYIRKFNQAIDAAESPASEDPVNDKLDAIVLFFFRCEQLQPVKQSRRTNLAVLNYHLAKYNFPCVLFKGQIEQISGRNVSMIDYLSFDDLRTQVIQGMKNWCKKAGIAFPFGL